jgi:hypothetical protein
MSNQEGWFLPREAVNGIQAESIDRTIARAKHALYTDIGMRINGQNEHFQADWIKHMRREPLSVAADLHSALQHTTFLLHSACLVLEDEEARKTALEAVERARAVLAKVQGEQA